MAGVYTIDFSPINQTNPNTLFKLLTGKYVPGNIMLIHTIILVIYTIVVNYYLSYLFLYSSLIDLQIKLQVTIYLM